MTQPYLLKDDQMYEAVFLVLGKLVEAKQPMSISDLDLDIPYDKKNRALHSLLHSQYASKAPGSKLSVSINKAGRAYWKKAAAGDMKILPMTAPKKRRAPVVVPPPVSMHDDVAAAFIKEQSLPVAFNAAMNACFSSFEQMISDTLYDFTAVEKPTTDLDKHNAKLYRNIQSIKKLCEVIHGTAESESS